MFWEILNVVITHQTHNVIELLLMLNHPRYKVGEDSCSPPHRAPTGEKVARGALEWLILAVVLECSNETKNKTWHLRYIDI